MAYPKMKSWFIFVAVEKDVVQIGPFKTVVAARKWGRGCAYPPFKGRKFRIGRHVRVLP